MNDLLIVKTKDISKVKKKKNQLIFCSDSSIYFDYTDNIRLRNAGAGANLPVFSSGSHYEEGDLVLYNDKMYRSKQAFTPNDFRCCDWEYLGGTSSSYIDARDVLFDDSASEIELKTVQDVLDNIISRIVVLESDATYKCVLGSF